MKIAVRLEGGIGDCLLGNRFVPAILEQHPGHTIDAFIDSEGKTFQRDLLNHCYWNLYSDIKIIPRKKYKDFWVDCQFGTDNYFGALENVPDDIRKEMESYDKFYDLHIDSLKWVNYDFDWLRYFKFFPRPLIQRDKQKKIVLHLVSATSVGHMLDDWYRDGLINKLCSVMSDYEVVAIATEETAHLYNSIKWSNFRLHIGDIPSIVSQISRAAFMVSIDSGFRYLAYGYSIPTVTFSKHCVAPYSPIPSHMIRWLIFPETTFPLNYNHGHITSIVQKTLESPGSILVPQVQDFDMQCVRRKYTINKDKTHE